jgi:integrase
MPLWKTKSGYRAQFQHEKKRYSKTGFPTQKAAEKWIVNKRAELEQETMTPPSPPTQSGSASGPLDLETLMVRYLRVEERRLAPITLRYRKTVFRRFLAALGNIPVPTIATDQVEKYLLGCPTNNQFNKERTELMRLFNWAHRRLLVHHNPVLLVDKLSVNQPKKLIPTPQEMSKILLAAGKDRSFLLVLYHTLGRIDEVLRLKWEDINWDRQEIRLWTRKRRGGNWQYDWLPMNADLERVLRDLYRKRTQDEWVFINPRTGDRYTNRFELMRRICQRAGVPQYTYHCIRHFVASYLYDKEKRPLAEVSKLLRHRNFQTTERYLQLIDPNLRQTMRLLEGGLEKTTHDLLVPGRGYKNLNRKSLKLLVPEAGLEPAQGCPRGILSPLRLPIPPLRQFFYFSFVRQDLASRASKKPAKTCTALANGFFFLSPLPRWGERVKGGEGKNCAAAINQYLPVFQETALPKSLVSARSLPGRTGNGNFPWRSQGRRTLWPSSVTASDAPGFPNQTHEINDIAGLLHRGENGRFFIIFALLQVEHFQPLVLHVGKNGLDFLLWRRGLTHEVLQTP